MECSVHLHGILLYEKVDFQFSGQDLTGSFEATHEDLDASVITPNSQLEFRSGGGAKYAAVVKFVHPQLGQAGAIVHLNQIEKLG